MGARGAVAPSVTEPEQGQGKKEGTMGTLVVILSPPPLGARRRQGSDKPDALLALSGVWAHRGSVHLWPFISALHSAREVY